MIPRQSNLEGCSEEMVKQVYMEYAPFLYVTTPARPVRGEKIMRWTLTDRERELLSTGDGRRVLDIFMTIPVDAPVPVYQLRVGYP